MTDNTLTDNMSSQSTANSDDRIIRIPMQATKKSIEFGTKYWAEVNNTEYYGIFVSLDGVDGTQRVSGLVHESNLPEHTKLSDFAYGDEVVVELVDRKSNGDLSFKCVEILDSKSGRSSDKQVTDTRKMTLGELAGLDIDFDRYRDPDETIRPDEQAHIDHARGDEVVADLVDDADADDDDDTDTDADADADTDDMDMDTHAETDDEPEEEPVPAGATPGVDADDTDLHADVERLTKRYHRVSDTVDRLESKMEQNADVLDSHLDRLGSIETRLTDIESEARSGSSSPPGIEAEVVDRVDELEADVETIVSGIDRLESRVDSLKKIGVDADADAEGAAAIPATTPEATLAQQQLRLLSNSGYEIRRHSIDVDGDEAMITLAMSKSPPDVRVGDADAEADDTDADAEPDAEPDDTDDTDDTDADADVFVCECGREFDNEHSLNGHKAHCDEYGKGSVSDVYPDIPDDVTVHTVVGHRPINHTDRSIDAIQTLRGWDDRREKIVSKNSRYHLILTAFDATDDVYLSYDDVADMTGLAKDSIAEAMNVMYDRELVDRARFDGDARVYYRVTPAGRDLFADKPAFDPTSIRFKMNHPPADALGIDIDAIPSGRIQDGDT